MVKKVYKNTGVMIYEENNRVFIDIDDLKKLLVDLCLSKTRLDIHSIRVISYLLESLKRTHEAYSISQEKDVNEESYQLPLLKSRIKKLIQTSYSFSKKEKPMDSGLDELEVSLAPEPEQMNLNQDQIDHLFHSIDLILSGIDNLIKTTSQSQVRTASNEKNRKKKKKRKLNQLIPMISIS